MPNDQTPALLFTTRCGDSASLSSVVDASSSEDELMERLRTLKPGRTLDEYRAMLGRLQHIPSVTTSR